MCCLPSSPCGGTRQVYNVLQLNAAETQGLDDVFEDVCKFFRNIFGCEERSSRGEQTLLAQAHHVVTKSLCRHFPQADSSCISNAVSGIVNALGNACAAMPDQNKCLQVFFQEASPHIGQLLVCLFGEQRATQIQLNAYNALFAACLPQLLQFCLPMLCNGMLGGLCPTVPPIPPVPQPPLPPTDGPSLKDVSRCGGAS